LYNEAPISNILAPEKIQAPGAKISPIKWLSNRRFGGLSLELLWSLDVDPWCLAQARRVNYPTAFNRLRPRIGLFRGPVPALLWLGNNRRNMTLDQTKTLIKHCAEQMHARYNKPVFDEWAVISLADGKGAVLAYIGPRKEGFKKNFLADAGGLRTGLLNGQYQTGDFEFARHGVGTGFESFLVLGKGLYLICNNTVQSMDAITQNPLWLSAQVPFVELSDKVRSDPLVVV